MKKNIFLLLILFLLTGCTCNYNVSVNKDLTIDEEITIYGTSKLYSAYYKTNKVDVLKENLDHYVEELKENNYEYSLYEEDNPYIVIKKKYQNMEEYLNNSKFFNDYFDEISYNKDGNIVKLETVGFNPNEEDNPDRFYVENALINVKLGYEVVDTNMELIDELNNRKVYRVVQMNKKIFIVIIFRRMMRISRY